MPKHYLTIQQAAKRLGISANTLRRWEEKGILIPKRSIGNQRRYLLSDIEKREKKGFTINEAAARLYVSPNTLRRWEAKGIVTPKRTIGNQRFYTLADIKHLEEMHYPTVEETQQHTSTPVIARNEATSDEVEDAPRGTISSTPLVISSDSEKSRPSVEIATSATPPRNDEKNTSDKPRFLDIAGISDTPEAKKDDILITINSKYPVVVDEFRPIVEKRETHKDKNKHFFLKTPIQYGFAFTSLVLTLLFTGLFLNSDSARPLLSLLLKPHTKYQIPDTNVLQAATKQRDFALRVSVNADFLKNASVAGTLTAPNILYSVVAGDNITVTGDPQNPVISANASGVTSLGGETGALALVAGNGITVDGLTITNSDPGSAINTFGTIKVESNTISAGSNTDTLEFAAGTGISLATNNKTITISNTGTDTGIITVLEGGTELTDTADTLDFLGGDFDLTESPSGEVNIALASTLTSVTGVSGNFAIGGDLTLDGDTINDFTGTDTGLEVSSGVLTLLTTCADNEILKYTALGGWECSNDAGTGAAVAGSGAQNQIAYWTNATTIAGDNDFYWDSTFERFAIGTAGAPIGKFTVTGQTTGKALAILNETGDQNILTASASGITQLTVDPTGNLTIEGALADLSGTVLEINDDLKVTGNDIIDSGDVTRITLGTTNTITGSTLTLSGTSTLDATALTAINGGATTINFDEFDVSSANGGITINDDSNAGHITIEGTRLDLDSLEFITSGTITTAAANDLTITAGGGNVLFTSGTTLNVGGGAASAFNFFADSVAGADGTLLSSDNDLYIEDDLEVDGQTRFGNITYTWPGSITDDDYVLQTQTDGTLAWVDPTILGTNYWDQIAGVLTPKIQTQDLLIGSNATNAAKFAFINVNNGTPTASISAITSDNALSLDAAGTIFTTNKQTLTLGSSSTGDIAIGNTGFTTCTALETVNGVLTCGSDDAGSGGTNYWQLADGAISPFSETLDVLIGATATSAAEFAITGIANGTPTASLSASTNNLGLSLSASDSRIQSLQNQSLTLGGDTTGNIVFSDLALANAGLTLPSGQNLTLAGLTNNGGLLYTDASGVIAQTSIGNLGECLVSQGGGSPSWSECGAAAGDDWNLINGALSPVYASVADLLLGNTATTSAKFAFVNVNSGTPTASISANITDSFAFLTGTGNLGTTNKQTLTLGGTSTGNIILGNTGFTTCTALETVNGVLTCGSDDAGAGGDGGSNWTLDTSFGVLRPNNSTLDLLIGGTASSSARFHIYGSANASGTPVASISGTTNQTAFIVDNSGTGDLFSANSSGLNRFVITQNGRVGIGTNLPTAALVVDGPENSTNGIQVKNSVATSNSLSLYLNTISQNPSIDSNGGGLLVNFGNGQSVQLGGSGAFGGADLGFTHYGSIDLRRNTDSATALRVFDNPGNALFTVGTTGTAPVATISANTSFAALVVDNKGAGDLFTASSSGLSRFTIAQNGVLYTNGIAGQTVGTASCVTTTNGIVTGTSSCPSVAANNIWNTENGTIFQGNTTQDLLIGGTASNAAKFAVLNVNGSATPVASLSAGVAGGLYVTADGTLTTTNKQSLTLGTSATGNIAIGTDATDRSITIGNTTSSAPVVIESGTGGINLGDTANLKTIDIGGNNNSGTDTIRIATNATGADTITIGNTNAATSITGNTWSILDTGVANFTQLNVDSILRLDGQTLSAQSGDLILDAAGDDIVSSDRVTLGSQNPTTLATLDVRALSGTLSVATISGTTSFASLVIENSGAGDIFTASASGRTRLALSNNGELRMYDADESNYTGFKTPANITSNAIYTFPTALPGSNDYVLIAQTDGSLSWVDAGSLPSVNYWDQSAGVIYPKNAESFDLLLGATATGSAEFAVTGISSGTPIATLSASTNNLGLALSASDSTIQSLNFGTLTLGGATTGNIALLPQNGIGFITATGRVGINTTTTPLAALDIRGLTSTQPAASVSANSDSFVGLVVDNRGTGDLFTASSGGVPKFTIQNNGTLVSSHYTTAGGIFYGSANGAINLSAAGVTGQILQSNGSGAPTWVPASAINFWQRDLGSIAPLNITDDFLLGSAATESARFAVLNIAGGTPVASLSAGTAGGAFLTASGNLQTTAFQTLTLGGGDTGDLALTPKSGGTLSITSDNIRINDLPAATSASLTCVAVENGIVTATGGCGAGAGGSVWTVGEATGVLYPQNPTLDLLIGGTSTASAKFAILNVAGSLTPIASVSAGTTGAAYLTAAGNLATTANQTLSFGGQTTGNLLFNPLNGTGFSTFNGRLGINTANPLATLDVRSNLGTISTASVSGNTALAGLIVDNSGTGDLFTASSSGLNRFVITQAGDVGIGVTRPSAKLHINQTHDYVSGLRIDSTADGFQSYAFDIRSPEDSSDVIYSGENRMFQVMGGSTFWNNPAMFVQAKTGSLTSLKLGSHGSNIFKGTVAIASIAGQTSFSTLVVDNSGAGDLFTASSSGLTRFAIKQNGDLQIGNLTYTFPSSHETNYILQNDGSGVLSWVDPGDLPNVNTWLITDGSIAPQTASVLDLLIGGTASNAAKFAVLNINGDATPIASLSATTASGGSGNGIVLNADGSIQTLRNNTLTLGGDTTGSIAIDGTIITLSGDLILNPFDELVLADTKNLIIGGHVGNIDYNALSNSANTNHGLNADNDLFIEGELEVDGAVYLDNATIDTALSQGFLIFPDSSGILTQDTSNLYYDDTNNRLGLGVASNLLGTLDLRGTSDTLSVASVSGKSNSFAAMVIDNRGSGDLFTASRSGQTKFTIGLDRIQIGTGSATGAGGAETPQLLGLDSKGSTGDPSGGRQGDMYYNTVDEKFRCYQGTGWRDCIAISQSEYLRAEDRTPESTETSTNDHLNFDTVAGSSGSSISLTTGTHDSGGGRFTLTAGRTYRLTGQITFAAFGANNGTLEYSWYNVTSSSQIGNTAAIFPGDSTTLNGSASMAEAIITPTQTTIVELRFVSAGSVSSIGYATGAELFYPYAHIEVLSGAQEVSASEYVRAYSSADQTGDKAAGDHLKIDTVQAFSGSSITLNTETYPSQGRFTLAAGKTYKLNAYIPFVAFSDNNGYLTFRWYNVTASSYLGTGGWVSPVTRSSPYSSGPYAEAIVTPSVSTVVEVRIDDASFVDFIGDTSPNLQNPTVFIEVLSDNTKVAQFTGATSSTDGALGYIPAPVAGQQGSLLLGNGSWTARTNAFIGTTLTEPIASLSAATTFAGLVIDNSGSGDLFTASSSGLTRFVINNNGNVGIGTTTPEYKLHVVDNAPTTGYNKVASFYSTGLTGSTPPTSQIGWGVAGSSMNQGELNFDYFGSGSTANRVRLGLYGITNMTLQGDGSVGIGTNTPATRLHVSASGDLAKIRIASTSSGAVGITQTLGGLELTATGMNATNQYTPAIKFGSTDPEFTTTNPKFLAGIIGEATETYSVDTASGMALNFLTTPDAAGASPVPSIRMTIDQDGNVGIGTNTPSTQLQLHLSTGSELLLTRDDSTTAVDELLGGIGFDSDDGNVPSNILHASAGIYGYAAESHATTDKGGYLTFNTAPIDTDDDTANTERMRLTSEGYLGIASTNPTFHLEVNGVTAHTITNYGFLNNTGAGTFTSINTNYSAFFAGSIWVSAEVHADSDEREKNLIDIIDPQIALDAVSKLRPLHFQWKPELNKGNQVIAGFFAQEIEHIIPEAVSIQQGNLYADQRTLNYNQLTTVAISALQGLNKKVDATNAALFANLAITPSGDLNIDAGNIQTQGLNVSGNLEAQTLTLGGTNLNDRLLGLESGFASTSAGLTGGITSFQTTMNNQLATMNQRIASLEARLDLLTASDSAFFNPNLGNFTASSGAELALDSLEVNGNILTDSLNVLGYTTINELSVTGSIRTGVLTINGQTSGGASISTLNGDLKLQDQGFGGIDFLDGLVIIDTDGNIETQGTVTAKKFNVDETNTLSASVGQSTIPVGATSINVSTTAVTNDSRIFVTPRTKTSLPLSVTTQVAGGYFKVEITSPAPQAIKFDWFIVN